MKVVRQVVTIIAMVCIIMVNVALPASADVVQFNEAAKLGASIVDLYGMANNTNLAYDVASNQSALTVIENLYTEYSSSASDPYTLAAIGAAAATAGAIAVIYDAVTGQGYIQLYQEQYISSLDGYWDYQLADAGLVRDSVTNLFSWSSINDIVNPIPIYDVSTSTISGLNVAINVLPETFRYGNTTRVISLYTTASTDYYTMYINSNDPQNPYSFIVFSPSRFRVESTNPSGSPQLSTTGGSWYWYGNSTYYASQMGSSPYNNISGDQAYNIISALTSSDSAISSSEEVEIGPYWGDPLENPLEITIPDNTAPDYVPAPRRITTTMPVPDGINIPLPEGITTPEYGVPYPITDPATLNDLVPELWDNLVANDVGLQDAPDPVGPSNPSEVYIPLLPVTLPSFNFNFSGIWHYVREWVSSLGAWFTMVFTVWQNLPYAIVVPVYASAVIVIVLGVYKRFFM